eukprot:Plantae.Rhodophyta-Purpureofilum_apyrenoidigerum.ctg4205.p1 GENE.Plantae.Rhodophyta-Purpureofilum_apyrenoidigerum.ctg4205~~Plantae.Rhodophyta-Purpureofilum_apyrenoidigerum.ctg4205.p1  ORF type:complete len:375 (-),score=58.26 Plantae.Rhodophyta-Purpureofilum_apyrenoidigerum.ctg4205:806-1930(-)
MANAFVFGLTLQTREGRGAGWNARCSRKRVRHTPRAANGLPEGDFKFDWELMNERIAQTRAKEEARESESIENWKSGEKKTVVVAQLPDDYFRRLKFCGPDLVCGSHTGNIHMQSLRNGKMTWTLSAHVSEVTSIDFDGRTIVSGAVDGSLRVINASGEFANLPLLRNHAGIVTVARIIGKRKEFCSASVDGDIRIWSLTSGQLVKELRLDSGVLSGVVSGKYLLFGCKNGNVVVFTADKGQRILELDCFSANVTCLQYDEDSDKLVAGSASGEVKAWDLSEGNVIAEFKAHEGPVMSLQWDNRKIVTGGRDGAIRVWEFPGRKHFEIMGYTAYLTSVQFDRFQLISDGSNNVIVAHQFYLPDVKGGTKDSFEK